MWLLLADLNLRGGGRRVGNTAVLQATCVDATVIPYREQRLNFSLGCYGCREATDLTPGETILGFPGALLEPMIGAVKMLVAQAIPRSRAKGTYSRLAGSKREEILTGQTCDRIEEHELEAEVLGHAGHAN